MAKLYYWRVWHIPCLGGALSPFIPLFGYLIGPVFVQLWEPGRVWCLRVRNWQVECIYFLLRLCACVLHGECSMIEQDLIWYVLAQQFYTELSFWKLTWLLHEIGTAFAVNFMTNGWGFRVIWSDFNSCCSSVLRLSPGLLCSSPWFFSMWFSRDRSCTESWEVMQDAWLLPLAVFSPACHMALALVMRFNGDLTHFHPEEMATMWKVEKTTTCLISHRLVPCLTTCSVFKIHMRITSYIFV